MARDALGVVSGLAVLATGVVTVASLTGPADRPAVESLPSPMTAVSTPGATSVEGLPGVGAAVTRVLQRSGNAAPADAGEVAQLPPSVAGVLIEYGVPLRVPVTSGRGQ